MTTLAAIRDKRKFFVPEIIQTSSMDCGPAALAALLNGLGLSVSYGRLREACQTDVDGTSIDTLEDIANQLGVLAEQQLLPTDHVLLDVEQNLPAIAVVRHPTGVPHFVVCWRRHGDLVQVMDPAMGRRWQPVGSFLSELFVHSQVVPIKSLRGWLSGSGFQRPLRTRMAALGMSDSTISRLLDSAKSEKAWMRWAQLDAAVRMAASLQTSSAISAGEEATRLVETLAFHSEPSEIPESYFTIRPFRSDPPQATDAKQAIIRGAVLIAIRGRKQEDSAEVQKRMSALPADLKAALTAPPVQPIRTILGFLPRPQLGLLVLSGIAALIVALLQVELDALFRSTLHLITYLRPVLQRLAVPTVGGLFLLGIFLLTLINQWNTTRIGRYLEIRLRAALAAKLPTLNDHYFHSRPISDMTERAHSLSRVRQLPQLFVDGLRSLAMTAVTATALLWIVPSERMIIVLLLLATLGLPFLIQPLFLGLDMRVRTYAGSLIRSYLDALIGLSPTRTHAAERALTRDQEQLLTSWVNVRLQWLRYQVGVQGLQIFLGIGFIVWLVARYLGHGGDAAGLLLLFYWAMALPANAGEFAGSLQQYPDLRNVTLRLLEPLGAPSERTEDLLSVITMHDSRTVSIQLDQVSVVLAGRPVLQNVSIDIAAGTHVAVVGTSGAGKSTLVGLLLGFHRAATGQILVDGQPVTDEQLVQLRASVAWVDPDIRIWNRSLFDNLHYSQAGDRTHALREAIAIADLARVMARLPQGMATPLGEGGRLVSGGEGQRVRLGRTLLQTTPQLVLLDEPFRGLDRGQREQLLERARTVWDKITMIYVSHDIATTLSFPKVLVIENGQLIETGEPNVLAEKPDSRFAALLRAERMVQRDLWASPEWQRIEMVEGQLRIVEPEPPSQTKENG